MKLHFSWLQSEGVISPNCKAEVVKSDGVSPLCCLLTDDGGQRVVDTVSWLNEGINRIRSVRNSGIEVADWSRDAWGAELTKVQAKIYSLHDEDYFEVLAIDLFEKILLEWTDFIQSQPSLGVGRIVEL